MMRVSDLILGANASDLSALAAVNEDGDLMGALQSQYDELKKAQAEAGGDIELRYKDGDSEKVSTVETAMRDLQAAMDRLAEASAADKGAQYTQEIVVQGDIKVKGNVNPG